MCCSVLSAKRRSATSKRSATCTPRRRADTLRAVSREVQTAGWWFNTSESFTFTLNAEGKVLPPQSILKLVPARGSEPLVIRGTRLINPLTLADTFSSAPPPTS